MPAAFRIMAVLADDERWVKRIRGTRPNRTTKLSKAIRLITSFQNDNAKLTTPLPDKGRLRMFASFCFAARVTRVGFNNANDFVGIVGQSWNL